MGSGNNTAAYTPAGNALGMRQYYCVVSNAYGSVESKIAKVAVGCGAMTMDGAWRTFMCYNLGATETTIAGQLAYPNNLYVNDGLGHAAASALEIDSAVYGNLYQWGRVPDGHEKRNSLNSVTTNALSFGPYTGRDVAWPAGSEQIESGAADYGKFILNTASPYDWSSNPTGVNKLMIRRAGSPDSIGQFICVLLKKRKFAGQRCERLRIRSLEINSTSTYRQLKTTQGNLRDFVLSRGMEDIAFSDITEEFGESFKIFN